MTSFRPSLRFKLLIEVSKELAIKDIFFYVTQLHATPQYFIEIQQQQQQKNKMVRVKGTKKRKSSNVLYYLQLFIKCP